MKIKVMSYDLSDENDDGTRYITIGGSTDSRRGEKLIDWLRNHRKEINISVMPEKVERELIQNQWYGYQIAENEYFTYKPQEKLTSGYIDINHLRYAVPNYGRSEVADIVKIAEQLNNALNIDEFHQHYNLLMPKKIWFNGLNTTCEFWDGEKITVAPSDKDDYDKEVGVAMCIVKKLYGTRGKWLKAVEAGDDQNVI